MIIYTCITNGYDEISDDHYYDPDVQYVCFTDGTIEQKGSWEFRQIPIEHECPVRHALYPKIMQHKVFPMGEQVVWIDGCYTITKEYVDYCKSTFEHTPRAHLVHPMKFTYYEEVTESYISNYNSLEDILKITRTVKDLGFDFKKYVNPMLASFWSTVSEDSVRFNELWWELSQISTRCDQIGFVVSKQLSGLPWFEIENVHSTGVNYRSLDHREGCVCPECAEIGGNIKRGNLGRVKSHPKTGDSDQWMNIDAMMKDVSELVGMTRHFYNKHWKDIRNVSEYIRAKQ